MASAIICLATNKKFNLSKYIFDNMVKHLDGEVKFLMYPRIVQVFLDNQVEGMDRHNAIFVISSHTKKVFANIKREEKDFFEKATPLFEIMMVQAPEDMGEGSEIPIDPHHIPIVTQPSSSLPQKKQKSRRKQKKEIKVPSPSSEIPNEEGVPITSNDPLHSEAKTAQAKEIASLKKRVKKLEQKRKPRTSGLKRLRRVGSIRRVESLTKASLDMFGVNDLVGDEVVVDVSASEKVEQSVKVVEKENMFGQFMKMNTALSLGSVTLPSNTITNPKEDLKGITTRSGIAYKGPTIPTTSSPPKVVERETEVTKDTVPPANNGSTKDVQPLVVQVETQVSNSKPV
nr:reverse transcriptase domain-containing protein [Tanacetum cinerariifolium]